MRSTTAAARALAGLHARLAWRPAAAWAAAFATIVLTSALAYPSAFPDVAARARLAGVLHRDRGITSLFGDGGAVGTMAGFVEWRSTVLMGTIAAVWAVLAVTRMIRGAEDDGHADLLGAAPASRRALTGCALTAFALLAAGIAVATAIAGVAGGLPAGRSLLFGAALVTPALVLGAVAGLLAQAAPDRGRAAAWGGGAVAAAFALRVAADSASGLSWLGALSPLAWAQRAHPLTDPRPGWLLLGWSVAGALAAAAVLAAGRRDVGGALVREGGGRGGSGDVRAARSPRTPRSLGVAGAWGALAGWALGVGAFCFMFGMVSASVSAFAEAGGNKLSHNQLTADAFTPRGYMTTVLLMVSALVAVYAARGAQRAHEEEVSGRLALVLAGPARRRSWLAGRVARALAGAAALLLLAGLAGWAGGRSRGVDLGLGAMLGAGAAAVAVVAVLLGAAVLVLGRAPRLTGAVATGGAGIMVLLQLVGESLGAPSWVTWISPFAHAAQAPLHPVGWTAVAGLLAVAAALCAGGIAAFGQRDLDGP